MTSNVSRRSLTAILVASLFLITAIGAIAGAALINPIINASDYLTTVSAKSATVTGGMLLWLVNDIGIVFIGLLMFPILRKQNETLALGYVSLRMFEGLFMSIGIIFAVLLIPLSQEFIKAKAADVATYQAIGSVLKHAESMFVNTMQLLFLGLGGLIFTSMLYRSKLVPRFISVVGLVGYGLLLPAFIMIQFGVLNSTPGSSSIGLFMALPVMIFEIILMPIWLYTKGFNAPVITIQPEVVSGKMVAEPASI